MKKCPQCGRSLDDDSVFCVFCGAETNAAEPAPPGPEPGACAACGARLEADSLFCTHCGTRVHAEDPAGSPPGEEEGATVSGGQAPPQTVTMTILSAVEDHPANLPPGGQPAGGTQRRKSPVRIILPILLVLLAAAAGFTGYRYASFRHVMGEAEESARGGDYGRAASLYEEALEQNPRSRDAALGLAEACLHQGRTGDASEVLAGLDIGENSSLYPLYQTLTGVAGLKPAISAVETENFPMVAVTVEYGGGLRLSGDMVTLTEEGTEHPLTGFQAENGKLTLVYEADDTEVSDEKRKLSVALEVEGFHFQQEDSYRTPHFEPAQVRLVSTDVSEYPVVKAFFRVEDPAAGSALEGLDQRSFIIRERLEGGEYLSREVHTVEPLAGNQGLNIGLLADKSSSISTTDMGKIKKVMTEFVNSLHYEVGDRAEILAFDSIVQQMCTYTDDSTLLSNGIANMSADGMTALYNAIHDGINHAALQGGARCVIAFTDGIDNRSSYSPSDIVSYAQAMQVPVYIIGVGRDVEAGTLQSVAEGSGGRYWFIDNLYDLEEIFDEIYAEQKKLYAVEYISDSTKDAYASRDLEVRVAGGGYRARSEMTFQAVPAIDPSAHTSRYELIKEAVTWEEATQRCQEMGGHLATITSQDEMDHLIAMAEAEDIRFVWLGGYTSYDDAGNVFGHWVTGEPFSYEAWCVDEPSRVDSSDGVEEWYIMLWNIPSLGGWSWNDQRNDPLAVVPSMQDAMGYICEFEN